MSLHPERAPDYLEHIQQALERVLCYTAGKTEADFEADTMLQDAVLRNLGIVGEAAHRLLYHAPDFAASHPEIPLGKIYGLRNRIIHGYEVVDLNIVWNLVVNEAPELLPKVRAVLGEFSRGES